MASTEHVTAALRSSLQGRPGEEPPSIADYGDRLDTRLRKRLQKLLNPAWFEERFLPTAEKIPLIALKRLSDEQLRRFAFAIIPIRAGGPAETVRHEAMLVGLESADPVFLHDGLWTSGRLELARMVFSPGGTDHSLYLLPYLEALAVGDLDLAEQLLPSPLPRAKRGYRFSVVATNLLRALRDGDDAQWAREDAERFLSTKSAKAFEKLLTSYLLALLDGDAASARTHFDEISRTWASTPWSRGFARDPLHKTASLKLLGLAKLGEATAPGVTEIAAASPASNAELLSLLVDERALAQPRRSVVRLTGSGTSLEVALTPRPFEDFHAQETQ